MSRSTSSSVGLSLVVIVSTFPLMLFGGVARSADGILRLASTTSMDSSGLMKVLVPAFEKQSGYKVRLWSTGSGKAIQMGRTGKVDMVWVHSPQLEKDFISKGYGVRRQYTMHNHYILVCPDEDPARVSEAKDVLEGLKRISKKKALFVSRADDSGTHHTEMKLWQHGAVSPYGEWYYETGLGMREAMNIAIEKGAYILTDRGTWLATGNRGKLKVCIEGGKHMRTDYHLIMVNPERYPHVNTSVAEAFLLFVTQGGGNSIIRSLKINEELVFRFDKVMASSRN